jgi:hypothetical protein
VGLRVPLPNVFFLADNGSQFFLVVFESKQAEVLQEDETLSAE